MKQTNYILTMHLRNGGTKEETFSDEQTRKDRILELSHSANPRVDDCEIQKITTRESDIDIEDSFVKDIAIISAIITGEFGNAMLRKTLLSKYERANLIANVSIACYKAFEEKATNLNGLLINRPLFVEWVSDWAKNEFWTKYLIKL